jgi:hypothetical protein
VLVDVVTMLEVAVAIMDVVNVIAVGDHVAAVSLGVGAFVAGVQGLLGVALAAVHVVDMVLVPDGLAPVPRMMLVIGGLSMGRHLSSSAAARSAPHRGARNGRRHGPPGAGARPDSGRR